MIVSMDADKAFQHIFLIKILIGLGIEETSSI